MLRLYGVGLRLFPLDTGEFRVRLCLHDLALRRLGVAPEEGALLFGPLHLGAEFFEGFFALFSRSDRGVTLCDGSLFLLPFVRGEGHGGLFLLLEGGDALRALRTGTLDGGGVILLRLLHRDPHGVLDPLSLALLQSRAIKGESADQYAEQDGK